MLSALKRSVASGEAARPSSHGMMSRICHTEISHAEIERCVWETVEQWLSQGRAHILNVSKYGRKGVVHGLQQGHKLQVLCV